MKLSDIFYQIYFKSTGYSYTNLGRLFLRMFVGLMLAQFGVRQLMGLYGGENEIMYLTFGLPVWLIISVELFCSFCIMIGFMTRILIIPQFVLMICAACSYHFNDFIDLNPIVYYTIPFMFMGIYAFLLIVGPGKISVDYFYSLYLINRQKGVEEDLEVV